MIHPAEPGDEARIDAFLAPFTETSMFLRGNLAKHGLFETDHPHGTRYFLWQDTGKIRGVFGCTNGGYLMCQAPDAPACLWPAFARALGGAKICGMTGVANQVEHTLSALGLCDRDFALNHIEPLYRFVLDRLSAHAPSISLRRAGNDDLPLLTSWFHGYVKDTEPKRNARDALKQAKSNAERAVATNDIRLLVESGEPRAMTAINTRVGNTVQVSGVYVPPSYRGQGRGGRVVAAHLCDLRDTTGAEKAMLFAQNPRAARVYERIGFQRAGTVRVARLFSPHKVDQSCAR